MIGMLAGRRIRAGACARILRHRSICGYHPRHTFVIGVSGAAAGPLPLASWSPPDGLLRSSLASLVWRTQPGGLRLRMRLCEGRCTSGARCRLTARRRPPGRHRLHRPGLRADRRLLLAGAAAADDAALVAHQQRGRLDHLLVLRRLHGLGAGAGDPHRPHRRQARLPVRRRLHADRAPRLRPAGRRLLVGDGAARAGRHRLGRHLHDRA